ncbi:unnamed protein product [Eretmochelys imbricata]
MAVFIVLLTLLQVSSALYGPRLLTGEVGGSVTIECFYPPTKANRHDRKYWCKMSGAKRVCNTIISTSYFISKDYKDRASITDFPTNGTFTVQMTQLQRDDAGAYRCGIGSNNKALFVSMNLTVLEGTVAGDLHNRLIAKGPNVPKSPELVLGELRGSVSIQCQPENVKGGRKKFWCKLGKTGCSVIADSDGYVARNYEGRISITPEESSGTFKILINRLKKEDSGLYKCGTAMLDDSGNARTIDLQVTEESTAPREPRLLNGPEGGLVSAKCHYAPQQNYEMKYWCRWKEAGCSLVADTSGFVQDAFEGRIRIVSDNQENGTFTVVMSHLEEKDAGWYWCGAKDGDTEQTSSMKLHVQKAPVPSASVSPISATSALHSIPSHVNVINQTYPMSRVTEGILEETTPEERFVTLSNAVYDSIPSHVNVINQTYPVSSVTEGILKKTTPEDRFVTLSNAVYERIPSHVNVINQTYPVSSVTEGILKKTTPEDRFVTLSNAVYERIPSHVNVINQTYPVSSVTEGILEKTTPEGRFVTFSNAVYDSSSTSELQLLPVVVPALIVLLLLFAIILIFIKFKLQKKKEMKRSSVRNLEATETLSDIKYLEEQMMEENMDPAKQCEPKLGHDKGRHILDSVLQISSHWLEDKKRSHPNSLQNQQFQERLGNQASERKMTFLMFIFLLSFLQAQSARILSSSPIFGPRQVTGLQGGSVTVKCFYPRTSVNRHDRKYWCKESTRQCVTVISSSGYTAQDFTGRATITDFPEQGIFTIEISKLAEKDISFYKCGIGLNDKGLSFRVKLDVSKGPKVPEEAELYYVELGGSVTINCVFGPEYGSERKYMCRMGKTGCSTVIDTYGNVNENYKGRVLLSPQEPPGSFSLYMTQLRKEDSGVYLCGAGTYGEKGESKELDVHVYQETSVPQGRHVINGVIGGSVSVECRYDPRGNYTLKYWCKWRKNGCSQLINNLASMIDSYEGRIVLHDNPENGTFTVIMNRLTAADAGYYWCMTDGDTERKSTKELKIIEGQPGLTGPKEIDAVIGTRVTIPCSYPCKYYSYQKYWCKWRNTGCQTLISSEQNQTGLVVNCDKEKRTLYLTFDQVIQTDQGWYWCGVSNSGRYGETMAVYLTVNGAEIAVSPNAVSDTGSEVSINSRNRAGVLDDNSSPSSQEHDSSKVILSVLLPIAAVCLLLATAFVVVKFRLLKRTDLVSVGSYRTNISMSEFENAADYGAKDNVGINDAQETQIGGVDEFITTPGNAEGAEEPPKVKRGSKEEADLAYTTFLLQANKVAQGQA